MCTLAMVYTLVDPDWRWEPVNLCAPGASRGEHCDPSTTAPEMPGSSMLAFHHDSYFFFLAA